MANMVAVRDTNAMPLVEGKWYCIGMDVTDYMGDIRRDWGAILRFNGDGWYDEDGTRTYLFDTDLQMFVADDAADAYQCQG